jgi:hypothetical protein
LEDSKKKKRAGKKQQMKDCGKVDEIKNSSFFDPKWWQKVLTLVKRI